MTPQNEEFGFKIGKMKTHNGKGGICKFKDLKEKSEWTKNTPISLINDVDKLSMPTPRMGPAPSQCSRHESHDFKMSHHVKASC